MRRSSKFELAHIGAYNSWRGMLYRCRSKKKKSYAHIKVCERWKEFTLFLLDMGDRPKGMTIERIDSNGNYEPRNCKWASLREQSRNRPTFNVQLAHGGKAMLMCDWAKKLGISQPGLHARIHRYGWTLEDALTTKKTNKWQRAK